MESHAHALHQLRSLLSDGNYPAGAKLPTERDLAGSMRVSRPAVRKALSFLEAEGKVWRHVGQGTFVGPKPAARQPALENIGELTNPDEVMNVRAVLEPEIARLAALYASESEFKRIENCAHQCASARRSDTYERWDSALHAAIAEGTHNALLIAVFQAVNAIRTEVVWGRLREASLSEPRRSHYCRQHAGIIDALRQRDPTEATQRMAAHIATVKSNMLEHPPLVEEYSTADPKAK